MLENMMLALRQEWQKCRIPELGDGKVGIVGGLPALMAHDAHPYVCSLDHGHCTPHNRHSLQFTLFKQRAMSDMSAQKACISCHLSNPHLSEG